MNVGIDLKLLNVVSNIFFFHRISLEVMTLNPQCESVETSEGVPVTVTGVAQCKIMRAPDILKKACEQFLGKSPQHVEHVVLQTLEGHLRAILGNKIGDILSGCKSPTCLAAVSYK